MSLYIYDLRSRGEVASFVSSIGFRINNIPPAMIPCSPELAIKLREFIIRYRKKSSDHRVSTALRAVENKNYSKESKLLFVMCSHFFNDLNKRIQRSEMMGNEDFTKFDRLLYGYYIVSKSFPKSMSANKTVNTAKMFVAAEKARIANGGKPITSPEWQEIETVLNMIEPIFDKKSKNTDNCDKEKKMLQPMDKEGIGLYKDLYSEIKFHKRHETIGALHKILKTWGIILKNNKIDKHKFTTLRGYVSQNGSMLAKAEIIIGKNKLTISSRKDGSYCTKKAPIGLISILVRKLPFKEQLFENVAIHPNIQNYLNIKLEL